MSAAPSDASDSRSLRIHEWISTLPSTEPSLHHRSSSTSSSITRADSPLLGFTLQENASHDPLYRPSPNYIRRLPECVQPGKFTNQDKSLTEMRVPPVVPEEPEQDILPPSLTRNRFFLSETRHPTHLSLIQPRPTLPRQPSLPVMRTTVPSSPSSRQTFDSTVPARVRSQSIMTIHRPSLTHILQSPVIHPSPTCILQPPEAVTAADNANPDLQRRKLNALVIASGLADEEELRADGLASDPNPQGESAQDNENMSMETSSPLHQTNENSNCSSTTAPVSSHPEFMIGPRTSSSSDDLDEFDEDASYYGKEMDPLFSPYSRDGPPASKWSLSSSVEMDLQSKRLSTSKSPKGKFKSFISRFSSSSQLSGGDKHVLSFATGGQEKQVHYEPSHSDILEVAAGRSSLSSHFQTTTYGSWESVPATPTTTSMSASTGFSPVTPNDRNESNDTSSSRHRSSDERLSIGKGVARTSIESPLTRDTSSSSLTWSGNNTSIPNSPVETTALPLKTSISAANLRVNGLKGLVSRPGPSTTDSANGQTQSEKKDSKDRGASFPVPAPRNFRERMMSKNNGSTLSLILGKGGNKTAKAKRKLLISGVEPGNYRRYEAISTWCEGFGEVTVNHQSNGVIVADFKDVNVANTVCRLQARVHIRGAGSVSLSWTTK
ncbi:hypothetical protein APHAL10511_000483 [Amanita phalloides]|nr:hypothetical protein APHAL10511_000483 [Amanita phalloides]